MLAEFRYEFVENISHIVDGFTTSSFIDKWPIQQTQIINPPSNQARLVLHSYGKSIHVVAIILFYQQVAGIIFSNEIPSAVYQNFLQSASGNMYFKG